MVLENKLLIIYFDRILIGAMITHFDGLILARNAVFNEKIKKIGVDSFKN